MEREELIKLIMERIYTRRIYAEGLADDILHFFSVVGRGEQLVNFLLHLNDKGLINNHDFDFEKEAKKYLKKIN